MKKKSKKIHHDISNLKGGQFTYLYNKIECEEGDKQRAIKSRKALIS